MTGLPDPAERPLLSVDEAREAIGCIGRSAFYDAIKQGEIPGVRHVGRRVYIATVALREWCGLESQTNGNGDGEVGAVRRVRSGLVRAATTTGGTSKSPPCASSRPAGTRPTR